MSISQERRRKVSGICQESLSEGGAVTHVGILEQHRLSSILQQIDFYEKTGLLTIAQGEQRVELFFQQGQITGMGPLHWRALVKKLVQAGLISQHDLQKALQVMGTLHNEMPP